MHTLVRGIAVLLLMVGVLGAGATAGADNLDTRTYSPQGSCGNAPIRTDGGDWTIHYFTGAGTHPTVNAQIYYGIEQSGFRQSELTNRSQINVVGHSSKLTSTDAVAIGYFFESTGDGACPTVNWGIQPDGTDMWGQVRCVSWHTSGAGTCNQHEVLFDASDVNDWANSSRDRRRSLACHEVSHAFGLNHTSLSGGANPGGCVRPDFDTYNRTALSSHDVEHLLYYY